MNDLGLNLKDLERRFTATLLRSGSDVADASAMGKKLAEAFHAELKGKRITIHLGRKHLRVLSPEDRKKIFLVWYVGEKPEHQICSESEISRSTMNRIKKQGRDENWAGRRNG